MKMNSLNDPISVITIIHGTKLDFVGNKLIVVEDFANEAVKRHRREYGSAIVGKVEVLAVANIVTSRLLRMRSKVRDQVSDGDGLVIITEKDWNMFNETVLSKRESPVRHGKVIAPRHPGSLSFDVLKELVTFCVAHDWVDEHSLTNNTDHLKRVNALSAEEVRGKKISIVNAKSPPKPKQLQLFESMMSPNAIPSDSSIPLAEFILKNNLLNLSTAPYSEPMTLSMLTSPTEHQHVSEESKEESADDLQSLESLDDANIIYPSENPTDRQSHSMEFVDNNFSFKPNTDIIPTNEDNTLISNERKSLDRSSDDLMKDLQSLKIKISNLNNQSVDLLLSVKSDRDTKLFEELKNDSLPVENNSSDNLISSSLTDDHELDDVKSLSEGLAPSPLIENVNSKTSVSSEEEDLDGISIRIPPSSAKRRRSKDFSPVPRDGDSVDSSHVFSYPRTSTTTRSVSPQIFKHDKEITPNFLSSGLSTEITKVEQFSVNGNPILGHSEIIEENQISDDNYSGITINKPTSPRNSEGEEMPIQDHTSSSLVSSDEKMLSDAMVLPLVESSHISSEPSNQFNTPQHSEELDEQSESSTNNQVINNDILDLQATTSIMLTEISNEYHLDSFDPSILEDASKHVIEIESDNIHTNITSIETHINPSTSDMPIINTAEQLSLISIGRDSNEFEQGQVLKTDDEVRIPPANILSGDESLEDNTSVVVSVSLNDTIDIASATEVNDAQSNDVRSTNINRNSALSIPTDTTSTNDSLETESALIPAFDERSQSDINNGDQLCQNNASNIIEDAYSETLYSDSIVDQTVNQNQIVIDNESSALSDHIVPREIEQPQSTSSNQTSGEEIPDGALSILKKKSASKIPISARKTRESKGDITPHGDEDINHLASSHEKHVTFANDEIIVPANISSGDLRVKVFDDELVPLRSSSNSENNQALNEERENRSSTDLVDTAEPIADSTQSASHVSELLSSEDLVDNTNSGGEADPLTDDTLVERIGSETCNEILENAEATTIQTILVSESIVNSNENTSTFQGQDILMTSLNIKVESDKNDDIFVDELDNESAGISLDAFERYYLPFLIPCALANIDGISLTGSSQIRMVPHQTSQQLLTPVTKSSPSTRSPSLIHSTATRSPCPVSSLLSSTPSQSLVNWLDHAFPNATEKDFLLWGIFQTFGSIDGLLVKTVTSSQILRLLKEINVTNISQTQLDLAIVSLGSGSGSESSESSSTSNILSPQIKSSTAPSTSSRTRSLVAMNSSNAINKNPVHLTHITYDKFRDIIKIVESSNFKKDNISKKSVTTTDAVDLTENFKAYVDSKLPVYRVLLDEVKMSLSGVILQTSYESALQALLQRNQPDENLVVDKMPSYEGLHTSEADIKSVRKLWDKNLEQVRSIFNYYSTNSPEPRRLVLQGTVNMPTNPAGSYINSPVLSYNQCKDLLMSFGVVPNIINHQGLLRVFRSVKLWEWLLVEAVIAKQNKSDPSIDDKCEEESLHSRTTMNSYKPLPLAESIRRDGLVGSKSEHGASVRYMRDPYDLCATYGNFGISLCGFIELLTRIACLGKVLGVVPVECVKHLLRVMDISEGKKIISKGWRKGTASFGQFVCT